MKTYRFKSGNETIFDILVENGHPTISNTDNLKPFIKKALMFATNNGGDMFKAGEYLSIDIDKIKYAVGDENILFAAKAFRDRYSFLDIKLLQSK